jgi:nucleoside-diphosphate-sugar epimerase
MSRKCFLAGATGAIGTALAPLLIDAGYEVYGSTRHQDRVKSLEAIGVIPVVVDVFDAPALIAGLARIAPLIVIHQLTDLPQGLSPEQMADAVVRNARIRDLGTYNLVTATLAAGCTRLVAQSIAWAYAPGPKPATEQSPLDLNAEGSRAISVGGVAALEKWTLNTNGLIGTVLRYGQLYGPGTGRDVATGASPLHVEAAAYAALLAAQRSGGGIFNITEPNPDVSSDKARRELGWNATLRLPAQVAR